MRLHHEQVEVVAVMKYYSITAAYSMRDPLISLNPGVKHQWPRRVPSFGYGHLKIQGKHGPQDYFKIKNIFEFKLCCGVFCRSLEYRCYRYPASPSSPSSRVSGEAGGCKCSLHWLFQR